MMKAGGEFASLAALGDRVGRASEQHIDRAFRAIMRGPQMAAERGFVRLMTGAAHPFGNLAVISDPADAAGAEAAIAPVVACGGAGVLFLAGAASPAVIELLEHHGFEAHAAMPAMAVELDALAHTSLPAGYSLTRVGCGAEGDEWGEVFAAGFEIPHEVGVAFSPNAVGATTAADAAIQYFAVRKGGRMVGTSLVYLGEGVAGVYCVATIADERGRGLGAHLTAEPLRLARGVGYRVGVLQATEAGYAVYRRLGFADFGAVGLYVREAG